MAVPRTAAVAWNWKYVAQTMIPVPARLPSILGLQKYPVGRRAFFVARARERRLSASSEFKDWAEEPSRAWEWSSTEVVALGSSTVSAILRWEKIQKKVQEKWQRGFAFANTEQSWEKLADKGREASKNGRA